MKISTRILLTFSAVFIIFVISIGAAVGYLFLNALQQKIIDELQSVAQSRSAHLETYFSQNIERLKLVTSRTALRNNLALYNQHPTEANRENITKIIIDAKNSVAEIDRICVLGLDGIVITSSNNLYCGQNVADQEFFIQGKVHHGVYLVEDQNTIKLYVSGPFELDGQVIGVGITVVSLDVLSEIVQDRTGLGATGEVLVAFFDSQGNRRYPVVRRFETEAVVAAQESDQTALAMKEALAGKRQVLLNSPDYRDQPVIAVSDYIESARLGLVAKIDRQEAYRDFVRTASLFVALDLGFLAAYLAIGVYLSRQISRPLSLLQQGAREIEQGNLDHRVGTAGQDEIGQLSRSFDKMAMAIKATRTDVDRKVAEQTREIAAKTGELEKQQQALLNILEDVNQEKNKSLQLAQDLEKFELAVANASDHIVITDPDGIVLYANEAAAKITGFAAKEIIGKKAGGKALWGGLMPKKFYDILWETIKTKKLPFSGEINNRRQNGQTYTAEAKISPVLSSRGEVIFFVGIERDVTRVKEIDRMKTDFISLASHQLRTPLSAMKWFLEMLLNGDVGALTKEQQEMVTNVDQSNERMIDLVNSLLNISRIESGRIIIEPQPTDLNKLLKDLIAELKPKFTEKQQIAVVSVHPDLGRVNLDPKLIRNVYLNLITNAIKYSPEKTEINIFVSKKGNEVLSQISDNGIGIPAKEQDKIFGRFFRAENVVKQETDGTGLGLYLVKAIVESSGGKVWFKSVEGQGTTFWFSLPLVGMKPKKGEVSLDA